MFVHFSLCLEWNALGMLDNAFTIFCEGVAANNCLQALDLRNNQISHDSAAELCRALKQNHTIKSLGRYITRKVTFSKSLIDKCILCEIRATLNGCLTSKTWKMKEIHHRDQPYACSTKEVVFSRISQKCLYAVNYLPT